MKTAEQFKTEVMTLLEARQEQYRQWANRAEKGEIPDLEPWSSVYRMVEETIGNCVSTYIRDTPTKTVNTETETETGTPNV